MWGKTLRFGEALACRVAEQGVLHGLKELCPKGAEGEGAVQIWRLLQEVAPKRLLPKLKQLCGRKKWLGLPVISAANSTSNLCTPEKFFSFSNGGGERTH